MNTINGKLTNVVSYKELVEDIRELQETKQDKAGLARVAISGSYTDLVNKPYIPNFDEITPAEIIDMFSDDQPAELFSIVGYGYVKKYATKPQLKWAAWVESNYNRLKDLELSQEDGSILAVYNEQSYRLTAEGQYVYGWDLIIPDFIYGLELIED